MPVLYHEQLLFFQAVYRILVDCIYRNTKCPLKGFSCDPLIHTKSKKHKLLHLFLFVYNISCHMQIGLKYIITHIMYMTAARQIFIHIGCIGISDI